ncbi:hypothetical protein DFP72DRAFT_128977 [Ephemerocybe angulata]|uniref:Uncharacterized protein n=1 Tax=Ephemerocybe angulata TaxID=980116 RepID=A0A8H6HAD6_9AGAR|nr:hypothetical protein DFP72DRAFT_128977 [Tulosesus angulatus]
MYILAIGFTPHSTSHIPPSSIFLSPFPPLLHRVVPPFALSYHFRLLPLYPCYPTLFFVFPTYDDFERPSTTSVFDVYPSSERLVSFVLCDSLHVFVLFVSVSPPSIHSTVLTHALLFSSVCLCMWIFPCFSRSPFVCFYDARFVLFLSPVSSKFIFLGGRAVRSLPAVSQFMCQGPSVFDLFPPDYLFLFSLLSFFLSLSLSLRL